jgi:hypothetical protein
MGMAYVDTKKLEGCWTKWNQTRSSKSWATLSDDIYKICRGVATQFHPRSDEELLELAHHAFVHVMNRIRQGLLTFTPGRAPVFNLLTTAVFRCLYTYKTTEKRKNRKIIRYGRRAFENLSYFNDQPVNGRIIACRTPFVKYQLDQSSSKASHKCGGVD